MCGKVQIDVSIFFLQMVNPLMTHNIYYVLLYMTVKIPDFLQEAHIKEIKVFSK